MRKRSKNCSAEQTSTQSTNPRVDGSRPSDTTDHRQSTDDVLVNRSELAGGLPDNTGGSKLAFGENMFT